MTNKEYALSVIYGKTVDFDIHRIQEILKETSDLYANEEESYLEDSQYEALEVIYKFASGESNIPVGSPVRTGKIELPNIMGSLDQVYDGDTEEWLNSYKEELVTIGDKQDGVSGSSQYINGELRISYSRGDGTEGADVTRHLKKIKKAVQKFEGIGLLDVRYEVIVPYEKFYKMKEELIKSGNPNPPKNPRNYTAGQMNAEVAQDWFYDNAEVIMTSINDTSYIRDKNEEYEYLKSLGFIVTPYVVKKAKDLTDEFLTEYLKERKAKSLTELDGIVIDINSREIRKNTPWKENSINPPFSKKFKVNEPGVVTEVKYVEWNVKKTGFVKPRIILEPVDIKGVTISATNGFNAKFIKDNQVGEGSKLLITRSGDVIPYILKVLGPGNCIFPDMDFQWNETNVDIFVDPKGNRESIVCSLTNTFGELKVPMLKEKSIEKLVDSGFDTLESIIKLTEQNLKDIIGVSAGEKIYKGLKEKLNPIKISQLAGVSNLLGRGIGTRTMEKLAKTYGEEAILDPYLKVNDLEKVDDIGPITAQVIKNNQKKFIDFVESIKNYYTVLNIKTTTELSGTKVCFTGVRDSDLEEKIKQKGGEIVSGIKKSDDNTFLVVKDKNKTSSKMRDAMKFLKSENIISHDDAKKKWGE